MDIETLALAKGYTNKQIKKLSVNGIKGDKGDPGKDAVIDTTLSNSGEAADAKVVGNEISSLKEDISQLSEGITDLQNGGYVADQQQIEQKVKSWLDEHPEATTTVQDDSLTYKKLVKGTIGYVTPEMFGAIGDGIVDDTTALNICGNFGLPILLTKVYRISSNITFNGDVFGGGKIISDYGNHVIPKNIILDSNCNNFSNISTSGLSFIVLNHSSPLTIDNCNISNYGNGILLLGSNVSDVTISNNIFKNQLVFLSGESANNIYGCIAIESSTVNGKLNIISNEIINTCIFGIIVYDSTFEDDFLIENNLLKNIGVNRDISDTNFSGCGGIYSSLSSCGIVSNNRIINVNEIGIEGSYKLVEGNYIENTGAYYYKFPIGDNAGIYGRSDKIIGNIIVGPSGNGGIHSYSPSDNEVCPYIYDNTIIDYVTRKESTPYLKGDHVVIGDKIYVANNSGTTSSDTINTEDNTITDGDIEWSYVKRRCRTGMWLQGYNNDKKVNGNKLINLKCAFAFTTSNKVNNYVINCENLGYNHVGYDTDTMGKILVDEDYSLFAKSNYGTVTDGGLIVGTGSIRLIPKSVADKYNWINVVVSGETTETWAVSASGIGWIGSRTGNATLKNSVSKKDIYVGTQSGTVKITRILITAG